MYKFNIKQKKQESSSSNINVLQLSIDIREVNRKKQNYKHNFTVKYKDLWYSWGYMKTHIIACGEALESHIIWDEGGSSIKVAISNILTGSTQGGVRYLRDPGVWKNR